SRDGPFVFQQGGRSICYFTLSHEWQKARKRAGCEGRIIHDLRRTAVRDFLEAGAGDRKSTRLNSSHSQSSYAVFCLKKKSHKRGDRSRVEGRRTTPHGGIVRIRRRLPPCRQV